MSVSTTISSCRQLREVLFSIPYHQQIFGKTVGLISTLKSDSLEWITFDLNEFSGLPKPAQADWEQLDTVLQAVGDALPHCNFSFDTCSRAVEERHAFVLGDWYAVTSPKGSWKHDLPKFVPRTIGKGSPKLRLRLQGDVLWEPYERLN